MVNFPCLILKVNPCLFSSFPYQQYPVSPTDGSPEHDFKLVSVKGHLRIPAGCHIASVMKCCCRCSLGSTREGFWQSLSHSAEDSSLSCIPCSSKWKNFSLHNHYQQISPKVFRYLSLSLIPNDGARDAVCQRKNIMLCSVLAAKNNFKGSLFLISCFGFHLDMLSKVVSRGFWI